VDAVRFIARKLKFQGRLAAVSIAVSFLVMILAVSISSGFRRTMRDGLAEMTGDIRIAPDATYADEPPSMPLTLPSEETILSFPGVKEIRPVAERSGIVKSGEVIHGVLVKGVADRKDSALVVSIPVRLAEITGLGVGDAMTTYFVGEKVRVRKFRIGAVHRDILETDDNLIVYANLSDIQRLNGWDAGEVSSLEVLLRPEFKDGAAQDELAARIGTELLLSDDEVENDLVVTSSVRSYPQVFDWLNLLDFNVLIILILMTVVAGFNMVSGLLIMVFRNIPAIGTLKTLGMGDRAIGRVFLRVASGVVLKGMLAGNALALLFCLIQGKTHLIPLDPENYFVSYVPVHVDVPLILAADLAAYLGIMLLLLIPTLFIARVDPAQTVRAN